MLTLILVVLVPLNSMYKNTNRFANQNYELSKFRNVPYQIEFANFGSSHGQLGFYYSHEESVNFNFSLSSQTPEYDLALLKDNLKHFAKDAIVVFPISYFTPYLFSHDKDFEFKTRNQRYYNIINYQNIIDFNWVDMMKSVFQPLNGRNILDYLALLNDDMKFNELNNSSGNFPLSNWEIDNSMSDNSLKDDAVARWEYWRIFRANLNIEHEGSFNPEILRVYKEVVDVCKENNLTPIFITLPVTAELNAVVDEEFYPIFKDDVRKIIDEIGSPIYLDYSHYDFISNNPEYFIDTDHLSKYGAMTVTNVLFEDINRILGGE